MPILREKVNRASKALSVSKAFGMKEFPGTPEYRQAMSERASDAALRKRMAANPTAYGRLLRMRARKAAKNK